MLENAVWQEVERLLSDPHHLETEFERRASDPGATTGAVYMARIRKLRRGIKRLIDSHAEGLIEKSEFVPRIRDHKARLERLEKAEVEAHETEVAQQQLRLVVGRIEAFAEQVDAGLASMDWEEKRDLVRCLVRQVEVDREEVTVCLRVEPARFARAPNRGFVQHCSVRGRATTCAETCRFMT